MKSYGLIIIAFILCLSIHAQILNSEDTVRFDGFQDTDQQPTTWETKSIADKDWLYTFGLRAGLGYSLPFQTMEARIGNGIEQISFDADQTFTFPNFAGNLEIKFGLPAPIQYFSVGFGIDYGVTPIDDLECTIKEEGTDPVYYQLGDITDVHTITFLFFLEFRYPIATGDTWIAPYFRVGAGWNLNWNTNDLIDLRRATGHFMMAVGAEYFVDKNFSLFFEPRFHTSKVAFTMPLDGHTLTGQINLTNFTLLVGFNYYFGLGKTL